MPGSTAQVIHPKCVSSCPGMVARHGRQRRTTTLTTTNTAYTLGGAADTWGRSWTLPQLANTAFRVRITNVASSTARDFFLDAVAVRVSYQ